jgi:hypothetical protein
VRGEGRRGRGARARPCCATARPAGVEWGVVGRFRRGLVRGGVGLGLVVRFGVILWFGVVVGLRVLIRLERRILVRVGWKRLVRLRRLGLRRLLRLDGRALGVAVWE